MFRLALHWQILIGMVVGAATGLALNATLGDRQYEVPRQELPPGLEALSFHDTPNRIDIHITHSDGEERHSREAGHTDEGSSGTPGTHEFRHHS